MYSKMPTEKYLGGLGGQLTEIVLNLVAYIQWEKPQVIEYDKICNGPKALSEILSIYCYLIMHYI